MAAGFALEANGYRITAHEETIVQAMLALAQKTTTLEQFAAWLATHAVPYTSDDEGG